MGPLHPLRRAEQIVDYLVNYDPRRKNPPRIAPYQPSPLELAVILRQHLKQAQSQYRHRDTGRRR